MGVLATRLLERQRRAAPRAVYADQTYRSSRATDSLLTRAGGTSYGSTLMTGRSAPKSHSMRVRSRPSLTSGARRCSLKAGPSRSSSRVDTDSNACALKRQHSPEHGHRGCMSAIMNRLPPQSTSYEERLGVFRHGVHRCGRRLVPVRDGRHRSRDETPLRLRINPAVATSRVAVVLIAFFGICA